MKIVSKEEIENRIKQKFPGQPFTILQYTKVRQPITIRCDSCQKIYNSSNFGNFMNRQALCYCHNQKNAKYKHMQNEQKIKALCENNPNIELIDFGYREHSCKYSVNILCKKCNQIFNKDWASFLKNQTCPYCDSRHDLNTDGFKLKLPKEYTLISEYHGTENKILIKHNCGFIWNIKPHTFLGKINNGYYGCPQCNHKRSHGEMKIESWLKKHNIEVILENIFSWSSNSKFRYDFYLPKYNLIIEYMGRQHYEEVEFFHDTLAERQEHDRIKEKEAKENNLQYLIISYKDFKNIDTILQDWFNDYPEKE